MGLNLTLYVADWEQLRTVPVEDRIGALDDAVRPPGLCDEYLREDLSGGWVRPPAPGPAWCAEYCFFSTTGSYKPHWHAGDAWDDMRVLTDATVREAMDIFLDGLIWDADPALDPARTGGGGFFPPAADRGRPHILLACPPEAVPGKVQAWEQVEPLLDKLRGPFAAECEGWGGRPDTFEEFTTLLHEWSDVTREAARRAWGIVGCPD